LDRLLRVLTLQPTDGLFTYSILVVDNDKGQSSADVVAAIASRASVRIDYCVAEEKNVAIARNVAVRNAIGDLIAFIDDDEMPSPAWLLHLFRMFESSGAAAVLGPVKPVFDVPPPLWIVKARLFERPSYPTGTLLHWDLTRTGNVLLRKAIFASEGDLFNPEFKHSEDKDFFRRMSAQGHAFVWCDEAVVYETEPTERFSRRYFLKRGLVRGNAAMRHQQFNTWAILKSAAALVAYSLVLPLLIFAGHHRFMKYLIKLCDHAGALLAVCDVNLVEYFGGA
jgi:glycosyltransferase involved in cell wall biosynthesis